MPERWLCLMAGLALIAAGLTGCGDTLASPIPQAIYAVQFDPADDDPTNVRVIVTASNPLVWSHNVPWSDLFVLKLEESPDALGGIIGDIAVIGGRLEFIPRLPLLPGQTYVATFRSPDSKPEDAPVAQDRYTVPSQQLTGPLTIEALYPSGNVLPANHLKFYVRFSQPMRATNIWQHFSLIDEETQEPVPEPFRETELWSEDGKQLTLWFHPGRQKTGVNLNVEIGPILEAGRKYTLVLSPKWAAMSGAILSEPYRKTFKAGLPDHLQPDPLTWKLLPPAPPTAQEPLAVVFPEPLDAALLLSQLKVTRMDGTPVDGTAELGPDEHSWRFTPAEPWMPGEYRLQIGTILEDLAGNSIQRPFEVDLSAARGAPVGSLVELPFMISE